MAIKGSHSLEKRAGNEGGMWVERKGGNCNSYADPAVAPQVRRWLGLWGGGQERERGHCWSDWSDRGQVC